MPSMSSSTILFASGKPPSTVAEINKIYATLLPDSTSPCARSISAFIAPRVHNFHIGSNLPNSILMHPTDPIPDEALQAKLEKHLAWDHPWDSHWNQLLAKFVLKHWKHAYEVGALKIFFVDPAKANNHSISYGLIHRWFLGRQEGLQTGRFAQDRDLKIKESQRRTKIQRQVQAHRQETLSTLGLPPPLASIFDSIKATSNTEHIPLRTLLKSPVMEIGIVWVIG
ncbi:hypothetical protein PTTG_09186 [Puccinia triticina 1-1 BBBD Race 1]|uniref:Uncharacterized protein n=1 Tax=Puccinia triticina (isolate 1-1 / race 1 (BBBD)) TaxID=630390 RepID=A0A180GPG3_PUCT1|nr:hypothetical protein PTTG_09186 [Puccinia triticina 1-1 BBBD Race 1]